MKVLLCAATETEIAPTIHFLATHQKYSVDILITGIGLMASSFAIAKAISTRRPEFILQAGVAGCLDERMTLSDVVVVANETVGDIGVNECGSFRSLFDMNLLNRNQHPFKDGNLNNPEPLINKTGLLIVNGVTVNEITTDTKTIARYKTQQKAKVETMEGAAVHYAGLMENIPFLQLRSLSNFIGERDKTKWVLNAAIKSLNYELQRILLKFFTV